MPTSNTLKRVWLIAPFMAFFLLLVLSASLFAQSAPARISILKTTSTIADPEHGTTVTPGGIITYFLEVTNTGGSTATSVSIVDLIPTGTTFVSASNGSGVTPGSSRDAVEFPVADLAIGESVTVSFKVKVDANVAQVTNSSADYFVRFFDPFTQTSIEAHSVRDVMTNVVTASSAEMTITKKARTDADQTNGATVAADGTIKYTLSVTNTGGSTASLVTITDFIPAGTTFVPQPGGPEGPTLICGTQSDGSTKCRDAFVADIADVPAGQTRSVAFFVKVNVGVTKVTNLAFDYMVRFRDPVRQSFFTRKGASDIVTNVLNAGAAALMISKKASSPSDPTGESVQPDENLKYILTYKNTGTAAAQNVVITDTSPVVVNSSAPSTVISTLKFNSANFSDANGNSITTPAGATVKLSSLGKATFTLPTLAAGATGYITLVAPVRVIPEIGLQVVNRKFNAADETGYRITANGNLQATGPDIITSIGTGDIFSFGVKKTARTAADAQGRTVKPGGIITYTLTATSNRDLSGFVLRDVLPNLVTLIPKSIKATKNGKTALEKAVKISNARPTTVSFDIGALDEDEKAVLSFQVKVNESSGSISNKEYSLSSGDVTVGGPPVITQIVKSAVGNRPPVARNDRRVTSRNNTITINVLKNDRDPDGDPLTIIRVRPIGRRNGNKGSVTILKGSKKIRFNPARRFSGTFEFSYTVSDGKGGQDTAKVRVKVGRRRR